LVTFSFSQVAIHGCDEIYPHFAPRGKFHSYSKHVFFVFTSVVAWKKNKKKRGSISLTIFCLHRENFLFTHPKPQANGHLFFPSQILF